MQRWRAVGVTRLGEKVVQRRITLVMFASLAGWVFGAMYSFVETDPLSLAWWITVCGGSLSFLLVYLPLITIDAAVFPAPRPRAVLFSWTVWPATLAIGLVYESVDKSRETSWVAGAVGWALLISTFIGFLAARRRAHEYLPPNKGFEDEPPPK